MTLAERLRAFAKEAWITQDEKEIYGEAADALDAQDQRIAALEREMELRSSREMRAHKLEESILAMRIAALESSLRNVIKGWSKGLDIVGPMHAAAEALNEGKK